MLRSLSVSQSFFLYIYLKDAELIKNKTSVRERTNQYEHKQLVKIPKTRSLVVID